MTAEEIQDRKQQALRAFQRDLPQLWAQCPGKWIAYRGEHQLGVASQKHALYQECFGRGLRQDEFVIFCIEPQETEITLGPAVLD